jgi:hypothetical protein
MGAPVYRKMGFEEVGGWRLGWETLGKGDVHIHREYKEGQRREGS